MAIKSRRKVNSNANTQKNTKFRSNEMYYVIAILAISVALLSTLIYSSNLTQIHAKNTFSYYLLESSMLNPYIINPPIQYYVGASPPNINGLINISANQVFCPENNSTRAKYAANFNYPYYVKLNKSQIFNYSFVYNGSRSNLILVMVNKPFQLLSYSIKPNNHSACLKYPNSRYEATLKIEAPNSSTVSKLFGVLYFDNISNTH